MFDAIIGIDGLIRIPEKVREALAPHIDGPIRVRLVPASLDDELQSRGVTADEIERIASVQLEERREVIRFLLAEGSLGKKRRAPRARR